MISNAEIKWVRSLHEKKFREREGAFIVEGEKLVAEALDSGFEVLHCWRRDEIGDNAMSRISCLSSPSPALAVLRQKKETPLPAPGGLCLALDGIRDPGNFGTLLRIADWFGIPTVFASPDCAELYNPKVVQATMGAVFRKEVHYTPLPALCAQWREAGLPVLGTFLDGENIYQADLPCDALVVAGSEGSGISAAVSAQVSGRLTIPAFGGSGAESLNVAAASAVVLSEFRRR